ncbi:MAG: hypothetical protein IJP03_06895 [Christensenellaceae bacterium]|nr:hypothetical protein [Christensenellaceae bacterium]
MVRKANMRMRRKKQPFWDRTKILIASGIGAVALILLVVLLILSGRTVEAEKGNLTFEMSVDGVIIRKETLYKSENYGKVEFIAEEGQAVTEGSPIATVYSWNYNDDDYQALKVLQDTIMDYQQDNILKDVINKDLNKLNQAIEEKTRQIRAAVKGEDQSDLLRLERELQSLMDERTAFLRESVTEDAQLTAFYAQEAALKAKIEEWQETTLAKESGVVSFYFDGTEQLLQPANLKKLTVQNISDILQGKTFYKSETAVEGRPFYRVVDPNEWYVIVICDEEVDEFYNGMAFNVKFGDEKDVSYTASISDHREDSGKHSYTFTFKEPIGDLLQSRQVEMNISATYVGVQVPESALKEEDGKIGVYHKEGEEKIFEQVTVLIKKDGYAIVQPKNLKSTLKVGSLIYP